jgi:hypothetical protein
MRSQFESILKKWGYNVYLQRRIDPYNTDTAKYERALEKHTVRSTYKGKASLQSVANEDLPGLNHEFDLVFYFKWDAEPRRGDRIYEENDGLPNNTARYTIDEALPMRGVAGQIIYWIVGATEETPKKGV